MRLMEKLKTIVSIAGQPFVCCIYTGILWIVLSHGDWVRAVIGQFTIGIGMSGLRRQLHDAKQRRLARPE